MNETAKPQSLSWAKKFGIAVLVAVTGWLALSEMIISVDVRPPREVYRECRQNAAVTWRNEQLRCRDAMREGQTTRAEAGCASGLSKQSTSWNRSTATRRWLNNSSAGANSSGRSSAAATARRVHSSAATFGAAVGLPVGAELERRRHEDASDEDR